MINAAFQWKCHPEAERLLLSFLDRACQANAFIEELRRDLEKHASTRLFDWLDYLEVANSRELDKELESLGFAEERAAPDFRVFRHPGAQLPRLVIKDAEGMHSSVLGVGVAVDRISDFLMARGLSGWIEGTPYGPFRRCSLSTDNQVTLWVVERRSGSGVEPVYCGEGYLEKYFEAVEKWKTRPRILASEEEALGRAIKLAEEMVRALGQDIAAWIALECERRFWQGKNSAGQAQYSRQQRLGMGWANHDHHTFRSSRRLFSKLVRLFEILGFHCRERFYAGEEAGWGAQVMEHQGCRLVLFLDVDLAPGELEIDFAHQPLPELEKLGTIGLWCALHGDSILKAGMHHLEAQFLFDALREDLSRTGIGMMDPFSSFPYLRQAFTHGEIWPVDPHRVRKLLEAKRITPQEAEKFLHYGAVGSHLENLQRREGYKGFNQKNVSFIIKKTDPRKINV
jgi:hypothetical protein